MSPGHNVSDPNKRIKNAVYGFADAISINLIQVVQKRFPNTSEASRSTDEAACLEGITYQGHINWNTKNTNEKKNGQRLKRF